VVATPAGNARVSTLWQTAHATALCLPVSGNFVRSCANDATANLGASIVWQDSHRVLTCPMCASLWHETQVSGVLVSPTCGIRAADATRKALAAGVAPERTGAAATGPL
jgi:hypothetical protein